MKAGRRFAFVLSTVCLAALAVRMFYVAAQPAADPAFGQPRLDGEYYVDWARALAAGEGGPTGAFYLAPLYPYALWAFFSLFGENFGLLYLLQQVLAVITGVLIALVGRRLVGDGAGLAACVIFLLFHPTLFFASRPMGEPLALLLLMAGIYCRTWSSPALSCLGAISAGLAALARPNLLLVLAFWVIGEAAFRHWRRCAWMIVGATIVVAPVLVRNWVASERVVPISSNFGITLYHGNGPGARGIVSLPPEFTGRLSTQRAEATRLAGLHSGKRLDAVRADRWWGYRAVQARLEVPVGSLRLLVTRLLALVANAEIALDSAPRLDGNPWRWGAPLCFSVLLGFAVLGVYVAGFRGTGGFLVWTVIVAGAVIPIAFYVSSRYRFPLATLLCLPAGVGLWGLVTWRFQPRREWKALGLLVVTATVSWLVPVGRLVKISDAAALSNRATSWKRIGNVDRAEADLHRALERDPDSFPAWFGLAVVLDQSKRWPDAETHYREALARNPASAEAAGNLTRLLILTERAAEAIPILRRVLTIRPCHAVCWTHLVAALHLIGHTEEAEQAVTTAQTYEVAIDPGLVELLRRPAPNPTSP